LYFGYLVRAACHVVVVQAQPVQPARRALPARWPVPPVLRVPQVSRESPTVFGGDASCVLRPV
jgi:hypothetical protein